jgi:hypothetical protein
MKERGNKMKDILEEMAADADTDQLDNLSEGKLDAVAKLAKEASSLESIIFDLEAQTKTAKASLYKITDEQLPETLEEMGLRKFTLMDGSEISVKPIYSTSIPKDRKDEAFDWLRSHGFGDLVKNNVTVTFGRGEDKAATAFIGLCGSEGFVPSQNEKVESMTLKAWLRERVEAGDAVPLDLFGAYISQRATIKRSK